MSDPYRLMSVLLAKTMTREELINQIQEQIDKYREAVKLNKSGDDEFMSLAMWSSLLLMKQIPKSPIQLENEFEELTRIKDLIKNKNQQ